MAAMFVITVPIDGLDTDCSVSGDDGMGVSEDIPQTFSRFPARKKAVSVHQAMWRRFGNHKKGYGPHGISVESSLERALHTPVLAKYLCYRKRYL